MKNEYIVAIDYRANYKPLTIDYKMLKAENLLDAMNEAEQYMDKETVYLLKIMKRSGAAHKVKGVDAREATYTDVLTNRGNGWHSTDVAHCEQPWRVPSAPTRRCAPSGNFSASSPFWCRF